MSTTTPRTIPWERIFAVVSRAALARESEGCTSGERERVKSGRFPFPEDLERKLEAGLWRCGLMIGEGQDAQMQALATVVEALGIVVPQGASPARIAEMCAADIARLHGSLRKMRSVLAEMADPNTTPERRSELRAIATDS